MPGKELTRFRRRGPGAAWLCVATAAAGTLRESSPDDTLGIACRLSQTTWRRGS